MLNLSAIEVGMSSHSSPLVDLEPRLRSLLPAELYALAWIDPQPETLMRVFEHLRTLQYILYDYVPRDVLDIRPQPGELRYGWQTGTLLFTDLAGFTPLLEASSARGLAGAEALLDLLNSYFAEMAEIISKSGGNLLEFTGDAMVAQFSEDDHQTETLRAVHAGLRMQRAMQRFAQFETFQQVLSLQMRVGIHAGRFLTADIGTPLRMEHVLLGHAVQRAKQAEAKGTVGRVCLTEGVGDRLQDRFRLEPTHPDYWLVVDDLVAEQLGEYDLDPVRRRLATPLLLDRSVSALIAEIQAAIQRIEPLSCYLPRPVLRLVVENAAQRQIPPAFPEATVMFVNLQGIAEALTAASSTEIKTLMSFISKAFALINAAVESRGGIVQKVTYHAIGSNILIHFGGLNPHPDDPLRAVDAAIAIRTLVQQLATVFDRPDLTCRIGLTRGAVFAAEIGEPRGRREFNILGDPVNTAARLVNVAQTNQILISGALQPAIAPHIPYQALGAVNLKGKAQATPIFAV